MDKSLLIHKVLEGTADEAEKKELDDWIAMNPINKEEFENLKLFWQNTRHTPRTEPDAHFYEGFQKIKAIVQRKQRTANKIRTRLALTALLGSVLISLSVAFFIDWSDNKEFRGNLSFESAYLGHVIATLEREYGINIELEQNEMAGCKFTGTFYRTRTVADVVHSLADALNTSYEVLGVGKYRLAGGGC